MNRNTSVSLGEHFTAFIGARLGQGRYTSASDVMRAALRLIEEQEAKLTTLRAALVQGEESGVSKRNVRGIWADVSVGLPGAEGGWLHSLERG
ncbi:MAG TPA: type II toxin-antitoxin system ParD family antitoxin [Acetobacteraceae bacterium]